MAEGDKEVMSIDVGDAVGKTSVAPSFVQRAGLYLALGVGLVIAAVTVLVIIFLFSYYPSRPSGTFSTAEEAKAAMEEFKALSEITVKNATDLFQTVVTQALLPVFTAILGYIFAKGGKDGQD